MRITKLISATLAAAVLTGCSEAAMGQEDSVAETAAVTAESSYTPDESRPDEEPPEESDELYDTTPISQAYLSGDTSGLDELQLEIYELASGVLEEIVTEDMSDYKKELAVHDYIVNNTRYEVSELGIFETHSEHSVDPYGMLARGTSICKGYTTTFQLFMDMLEIPCISINAAANGGEAHAWNMVEINGHWYYVDVTWDDPVPDVEGRPVQHKYLNVSREHMANRHEWNSSSDPDTDSREDSYIAHELRTVESVEDIADLMAETLAKGSEDFYFEPADRTGWSLERADGFDDYAPCEEICPELAGLSRSFTGAHKNFVLRWQRIELDGKIVVGGYMTMIG